MSRRRDRRKRKKGLHPAVAVLILLGSIAFVLRPLWSGGEDPTGLVGLIGLDEPPDMSEGDGDQAAAGVVKWQDLLAIHGSYERGTSVRLAFSVLPDAQFVAAAPAGETASTGNEAWLGEDPPMLRVGVVMISADSTRAVLAGQVVGVGDVVGDARIAGIEAGVVRVRWRGRSLTYDLDAEAPREFRGELMRREAQRQGGADASQEDPEENR